ncbi:TonB-dependent receptor plug domain-containing protein [Achromobacter insuavis]
MVLAPVEVDADALVGKDVYSAPHSSVYLSSQDLDRYGRVSAGDLLRGVPGVQVGDSRNGGALDVNIRGLQGQSRVAVRVDGAEQALDVYRGYAGTQQRSYIDPDLLGSVTINKGPSMTSGAIGGSVEMRTIGVRDILVGDQRIGLRLTGGAWNNGVAPEPRTGKPPATGGGPTRTCTPRRTTAAAACSARGRSRAAPHSPTATTISISCWPTRTACRATISRAPRGKTATAPTTGRAVNDPAWPPCTTRARKSSIPPRGPRRRC